MHGAWCRTRTWPTECSRCSASIYFFMCDCGSKVMFDELGPPWPQHDCASRSDEAEVRLVDGDGGSTAQIGYGVKVIELSPSFGIEPGRLPDLRRRSAPQPDPIEAMLAAPGARDEVIGVVREIHREVDPFRKLGVPATTIARAVLGPIGRQPVGRITLHAPSPEEPDLLESFTSWVPTSLLAGVRRRLTVLVDLEAVQLPSSEWVWFCRSLTIL